MRPACRASHGVFVLLLGAFAKTALAAAVQGNCANYSGALPDLTMRPGSLPYFSWNQVPVYAALANPAAGGLTAEQVGFLATHPFAVIIFDHSENLLGAPVAMKGEYKIAASAARIKAVNPAVPIVFYQNSLKDLSFYALYCQSLPYLFKNKNKLVTLPVNPVPHLKADCKTGAIVGSVNTENIFDWTNPKMIALWSTQLQLVRNFTYNSSVPLFSGIFLDLAEKSAAVLDKNTPTWEGLSSSIATLFDNNHQQIINAAASVFPFTIANNIDYNIGGRRLARAYESFMFFDFAGLSLYATVLDHQKQAAAGRVVFANANPCGPSAAGSINLGNGAVTKSADYIRAVTLAGYLVAACRSSYYSCTMGYSDANAPQSGWHECWHKEYNQALGAPLGAAKTLSLGAADYFYRKFASGTYAILRTNSRTTQYDGNACVCWSDGTSLCSDGTVSCASLYGVFKNKLTAAQLNNWVNDGCA